MDNSKKVVKRSGTLGDILSSGNLKSLDSLNKNRESFYGDVLNKNRESIVNDKVFKNNVSIVEQKENEIIEIDPKECEPWEYANRAPEEMGEMNELMQSIQERGLLQPVLIRPHPEPHGVVKYQIIFGRRRYEACLKLGIALLAMKKELLDVQKAILDQDAENRHRKNVSNYSNALLYSRLIKDGVFQSETELASKLEVAKQTLNDIMSFSKLPEDIVRTIPNIHGVSTSIAVKIISLINKDEKNHFKILAVSPHIGKTINSADKLEKIILIRSIERIKALQPKVIKTKKGKKLFTLKQNNKGGAKIILHDEFGKLIDYDHLCNYLRNYSVAQIYEPA